MIFRVNSSSNQKVHEIAKLCVCVCVCVCVCLTSPSEAAERFSPNEIQTLVHRIAPKRSTFPTMSNNNVAADAQTYEVAVTIV
jgi:hypothetical protein